jgi:hypothetical protein
MLPASGSHIAFRALLLALLVASMPAAAKRLAVMPLAGEDATGMVEALRAELNKRGGYEVLTQAQTQEKINGATDLGLSCKPADVGCLSKLGVLGDIHVVLSVATATGPTGVDLVLVLIDTEQGAELQRASRPFQGAPNAIALDALEELLDPEGYQGELAIVVLQDGAEVKVDDEVWGSSPLEGARSLKPGKHTVTVTLEGRPSTTREVEVKKGDLLTVEIDVAEAAASAPTDAPSPAPRSSPFLDPLVITPGAVAGASLLLGLLGGATTVGSYVVWALNARVRGLPDALQISNGGEVFSTDTRRQAAIGILVGGTMAVVGVLGAVIGAGTAVGVLGTRLALDASDASEE